MNSILEGMGWLHSVASTAMLAAPLRLPQVPMIVWILGLGVAVGGTVASTISLALALVSARDFRKRIEQDDAAQAMACLLYTSRCV